MNYYTNKKMFTKPYVLIIFSFDIKKKNEEIYMYELKYFCNF